MKRLVLAPALHAAGYSLVPSVAGDLAAGSAAVEGGVDLGESDILRVDPTQSLLSASGTTEAGSSVDQAAGLGSHTHTCPERYTPPAGYSLRSDEEWELAQSIIRELALPSSMATDPDGECFFCGGDANDPEDHAGDCLVTLARGAALSDLEAAARAATATPEMSDEEIVGWVVWFARKNKGPNAEITRQILDQFPWVRVSEQVSALIARERVLTEALNPVVTPRVTPTPTPTPSMPTLPPTTTK